MRAKLYYRIELKPGFLIALLFFLILMGLVTACSSNDSEDDTNVPVNPPASQVAQLIWPIDCIPGETCTNIGYPDINNNNKAHDCGAPGYQGHQGTDIGITYALMEEGTDVYAAADGVVLFVFDGKYDRCPDDHPDCQAPPNGWGEPGQTNGTTVCTEIGPYCQTGDWGCFWCFAGGNVVVIRHPGAKGLFATRYDHFKTNSITVKEGDTVTQGQKIGEVGSAGNSTGPHLHFEVWGTGFYELADPWAGECGPNSSSPLWLNDPPWKS